MDIIDNIINDWKSSVTPKKGVEFLSNKQNENIMEIFIAFEEKEKKRKAQIKMITLAMAIFLACILLFYSLLNFFNATTIQYDLSAIVIGSSLMIGALSLVFYTFQVNRYSPENDYPTLHYLNEIKQKLKRDDKKSFLSSFIIVFMYSLGIALLLSGIFHAWFTYFLIGALVYMVFVYVVAFRKHKKEYTVLNSEIDSLINELSSE